MAEDCKCVMVETLKRMQENIDKVEEKGNKTVETMYEIKESSALSKQVMDQIQKAQESQNVTAAKNQADMVRSNNEIKAAAEAGFKAMADEKTEEKRVALVKKEADAEALIVKKAADDKAALDKKEVDRVEKKRQLWALKLIGYGILFNTIYGLLKTYVPQWVGLLGK